MKKKLVTPTQIKNLSELTRVGLEKMVGILDDTCLRYPLGTRIKIGDNHGTVRYVGEVRENY